MRFTTQLFFIIISIVFTEQHHFFAPIVGEGLGFPSTDIAWHHYHGHHFFGHERVFHPGFPMVVNPASADLRTVAQLPVVAPSGAKVVAPGFGAYPPFELPKSSGKPTQAASLSGADKRPPVSTVTTDLAVEKSIMPKSDTAAKAVGSTVPL